MSWKWLKWLKRTLFPGRSLEQVVWDHWVPPHNSVQSFAVGRPGLCYYCLTHADDPAFERPCPRKRPDLTELA